MLTRSDPFYSPKVILDACKIKIAEFQRLVSVFVESHPYTFVSEVDPETGDELFKVKLIGEPPTNLEALAFSIFQELRAVLDQTMIALGAPVGTYFPFSKNQNGFGNAVNGWCKTLPSEITDV